MEANKKKAAIARTNLVLKRCIEAPCGQSPGFKTVVVNDFAPWLAKRRVATWRRGEPRTARTALTSVGPRGKASLLLLLRVTISGYHGRSSLPEFLNN